MLKIYFLSFSIIFFYSCVSLHQTGFESVVAIKKGLAKDSVTAYIDEQGNIRYSRMANKGKEFIILDEDLNIIKRITKERLKEIMRKYKK